MKKYLPWAIFALVMGLCLKFTDSTGLEDQAREASEVARTKTEWVENQTKAMGSGNLGRLSNLQKVLQVTRDPGSVTGIN